jgi:hypothetical protein
MNEKQPNLADKIAKTCFEMYENTLFAKNKLTDNEWTNMAAILILERSSSKSMFFLNLISFPHTSSCNFQYCITDKHTRIENSNEDVNVHKCIKIASMATGSKCLSEKQLALDGWSSSSSSYSHCKQVVNLGFNKLRSACTRFAC